jgi:hypothetical protein
MPLHLSDESRLNRIAEPRGRAQAVKPGSTPPAAATEPIPVFWIFADCEGTWWLREEGKRSEAAFPSRDAAVRTLRRLTAQTPSYRAFIGMRGSQTVLEMRNLGRSVLPSAMLEARRTYF